GQVCGCDDDTASERRAVGGEEVYALIFESVETRFGLTPGFGDDRHRVVTRFPEVGYQPGNLGDLFAVAVKALKLRRRTVTLARHVFGLRQAFLCEFDDIQRRATS